MLFFVIALNILGEEILKGKKFYFLTIGEAGYSRSWNYYKGLLKLGETAEFVQIDPKKLIKTFITIKKKTSINDDFVVMSPSHYLVPFARFFLGKNVYLDAGWSLFEGSIISRRKIGFIGTNVLKTYFIDLTASFLAKRIILESNAQKAFYCKSFLLRNSKCSVIYTGIDEEQFKLNLQYQTPIDIFKNSKIVLFRGKYTAEAGLEVLAKASKLLSNEKITFWIYSPGIPKDLEFSSNTIVIDGFLASKQDLAKVYSEASLTLGQLSNHSRLRRTIPHKAFESAFLAKPYLSARTKGILELFTENKDIFCFNAGDENDLAKKIRNFFGNFSAHESIGKNMKKKYDLELSQCELSSKFLKVTEGV
ncbi:MAG: glycosyltransferase [Actinobacteria bacterium]|nr:glycosyltransferase [Actinomycetota bacterium]